MNIDLLRKRESAKSKHNPKSKYKKNYSKEEREMLFRINLQKISSLV